MSAKKKMGQGIPVVLIVALPVVLVTALFVITLSVVVVVDVVVAVLSLVVVVEVAVVEMVVVEVVVVVAGSWWWWLWLWNVAVVVWLLFWDCLGDAACHVINVGTCCPNLYNWGWASSSVVKRVFIVTAKVGGSNL
jgi:hypothetical protein